ncbi:MAG: hypothetical protein SGJ18_14575 [Pseudomonadota bacterium]|nr:hypothetical protein [Pseudomonadota bacterium]
MKPLILILFLISALSASANTDLKGLKLIEKHETWSLTLAKSLFDLNKSRKNTLDLKKFNVLCEVELSQKVLPLNCYWLNERLKFLDLVSESDYQFAVNTYDNQCLNSVPSNVNEKELPNSYPQSMSPACIEIISAQKKKLRYIFWGKKTDN